MIDELVALIFRRNGKRAARATRLHAEARARVAMASASIRNGERTRHDTPTTSQLLTDVALARSEALPALGGNE